MLFRSYFLTFAAIACARNTWINPRGPTPVGIVDPGAHPACTYWHDNLDNSLPCGILTYFYLITPAQLFAWNPSLTSECGNYLVGHSYCVDVAVGPSSSTRTSSTKISSTSSSSKSSSTPISSPSTTLPTTATSPTPSPTPPMTTLSTTSRAPSSTSSWNGIATPLPTQPGMVDNCDDFYLVQAGETCDGILSKKGITLAQFTTWNKEVGSDCTGMWADVYVCTSIIGHTPTPANPGNGISTPSPIQPGMVDNCDAFYFVQAGDTCAAITSKFSITVAQFTTWNTGAGPSCSGLWANVNACVSIVGHNPTPANPGNGVQTPSPIQNGMTNSCKRFHLVKSGDTCATIAKQYSISTNSFLAWNPAAGSNCQGLWANTYACVGVL